jgi:PAS domain S-box-containing protein
MKIRSRVILSITILCIITIVIAIALFVTFSRINELNTKEDIAESLLLKSHELSELSNDYILFHEKRQQDQWETTYNSIAALLSQLQVDRPEEQILVDKLASNQKRLKEMFDEVKIGLGTESGSIKHGGDIAFLRLSWARLAVQAQGMIHDASRLSHSTQDETRNVHHRITVLIMAMIGTLIVFILVNYVLINRQVLRSVAKLQEGTTIIGRGNLDYRIDETARDEIGDLARSFNQMNVNLTKVLASKEELNREVEERKRAEATLKESEERFSKSFRNNPALLTIVHMGTYKVLEVNEAWTRVFGYTSDEAIGRTVVELGIFDEATYRKIMEEANANGSVRQAEINIRNRTGECRVLLVSREIIEITGEPYLLAMGIDITDLRHAEESYRLLFAAIEQAAEGVIITDATGIIQYVNPAEEAITGYCRDELIGHKPSIFGSDKHDENFYRDLWATINSGKVWSGRFINKKKDGTEYHEDDSISPVYDKSGYLTNFVAVKHDVTKQLGLQEQLFQSQKMEAIGTLAGGFAHDFNNKLQVIGGYVDLMLFNKDLPQTVTSELGAIKQTVESSAELIKGMMVFSRKTPVELQPIDLNKLIANLKPMLTRSITKMIQVDLLLADDLWMIKGDKTHIDQILMNLAVNARDAMPDGGKLTIRTRSVVLDDDYCRVHHNSKPGRYVLIEVSDTGTGMDKETASRIFEPFFTTKAPGKGTGLGLAVVYGIVEKHDGWIICHSQPSLGTTFKIYFPATQTVPQEQYFEKIEPPMGQGETILLVDDEPDYVLTTSGLLASANYSVITALNGKEALDLYEKRREEIKLVILDLIMPEMGGKECLQGLLSMDANSSVIMVSGFEMEGLAEELRAAGAKAFILKPFYMPQLLEKIRKIIDQE